MLLRLFIVFFLGVSVLTPQTGNASNEFIAGYNLEKRCIILNKSLLTTDGTLKDFDKLFPRDIATIYHEMWHAYFIECETKKKGPLFKLMQSKVDNLYAAYPKEKRMEIYEEAVADFIDAIIQTYVYVNRFMAKKTPEERERIRSKTKFLQNVYERLFYDAYNGFYTKNIVIPTNVKDSPTSKTLQNIDVNQQFKIHSAKKIFASFIEQAEKSHLPVKYISEAAKTISGVIFLELRAGDGMLSRAEVVFADVYLDKEDMNYVSQVLFEGKMSKDLNVLFSEKRFPKIH